MSTTSTPSSRAATPVIDIAAHWVEEGVEIVPVKLERGSYTVEVYKKNQTEQEVFEKGFAAALTVGDFSASNDKRKKMTTPLVLSKKPYVGFLYEDTDKNLLLLLQQQNELIQRRGMILKKNQSV